MRWPRSFTLIISFFLLSLSAMSSYAATRIVAAKNSSAASKAVANYICDGTSDQFEIEAAIDYVSSNGGGTVTLMESTFTCTSDISLSNGVSLKGQGNGTTFLNFTENGQINVQGSNTIEDMLVQGKGGFFIYASHVKFHRVTVQNYTYVKGAFYIYANATLLQDFEFIKCNAINGWSHGFINAGEGTGRGVTDILYSSCTAVNCGTGSSTGEPYDAWITGFDFCEADILIRNLTVSSCIASGSWESGFHFEEGATKSNVVLINCDSYDNGKKDHPTSGIDILTYGSGYIGGGPTMSLINCTSEDNSLYGFRLMTGATLTNCTDTGSDTGFRTTDYSDITLNDCESIASKSQALYSVNTYNITATNFKVTNPVSTTQPAIMIGGNYPSHNINLNVNITGGAYSQVICIGLAQNVTISGSISTTRSQPVAIVGSAANTITLQNMAITSQGSGGTLYGVYVANNVANAANVLVKNSTITDPRGASSALTYGIYNAATPKVKVQNVSVTGEKTAKFFNCDDSSTSDSTPPTTIATVNDGFGQDIDFTISTTSLSASWNASSDPETGISKYWYAIGTTAGGTNIAGWTDNGALTSVLRPGLTLSAGTTYYFTVKAENGAGLQSSVTNSNGQYAAAGLHIAPVSAGTIVINGTTSEWTDVKGAKFGDNSGRTPSSVDNTAEFKTKWDSTNLYVLFNIKDTNIQATYTAHDGNLWEDDSVELWIDTLHNGGDTAQADDYHITINPLNAVLDAKAEDASWDGAIQSSVTIIGTMNNNADTDTGYIIECAVPWASIGGFPGSGNKIGIDAAVEDKDEAADGYQYFDLCDLTSFNNPNAWTYAAIDAGDTTPPANVASVNDGTSVDIKYSASTTQISANWTASTDSQSGIARYWYSIGTTPGGTSIAEWTDNGLTRLVTRTGLTLVTGTTYYVNVKAENGAGLQSAAISSNGQLADGTAPTAATGINDGTGSDIAFTTSTAQLSANWSLANDPESGIARYWYSIGTSSGATNIVVWTNNGTQTSFTQTGLSLTNGTTYYINIRAENGAGVQSTVASSNGQKAATSVPSTISSVKDGLGVDVAYTTSTVQLSGNWTASTDTQSGIAKYWYSIGTTAGGTSIAGWTDNGAGLSFTRTGLSLTTGTTYYVNVKAENGAGIQSAVTSSNGQMADATLPSTITTVNDGLAADITYTTSTVQLSGNWSASSDSQSGIAKYWYSIGTTAGSTNIAAWTNNALATSFTKTGLTLINGTTYYVNVKAENNAGLQSIVSSSNGQMVSASGPSTISTVNDGTGADITYTTSTVQLSGNWSASSDSQSGISKYWYSIGTTSGGTSIAGWTNNGLSTSFTRASLTLTNGTTYYVNVKAENNAGLQSTVSSSNGQTVDSTAPTAISTVNDGLGTDVEYATSTTRLSGNWTASSDSQSGIAKYWYSIGTTVGGANITGWTDNGTSTSFTKTGLSLTNGTTYYVNVKAENGAGSLCSVKSANGVMVDITVPTVISTVNDSLAADVIYTSSTDHLSGNWSASSDAESGLSKYWVSIGTTPGGTNISGWANNGLSISVTRTGLSLTNGATYYINVKAENNAGLQSPIASSNGQMVMTTVPTTITMVSDGLDDDIDFTTSTVMLSANWDDQAGIAKYWYSIGTTAGGTDIAGWTDNGPAISFNRNGLTLSNGTIYYVNVKAENQASIQSAVTSSDGQMVDTTVPSKVTTVNDGANTDIAFTTSTVQLLGNWTASTDNQSDIAKYWYSIGTTAGGTSVSGWTDNGITTSFTRTGLTLTNGTTYFINVKAENGAGLQSSVTSSNGQMVDSTVPLTVATVNDGLAADVTFTTSTVQLSGNWTTSADSQSGIAKYWYSIGTTAGSTNIAAWTNNALATSFTKTGLTLINGTTYYVNVKAENNAGLQSIVSSSNGQMVSASGPSTISTVNDSIGADITYTTSTVQLSGNWSASSDSQSGIAKYWYSIGTTPGGISVAGWTNNGLSTSFTRASLTLTNGTTYYVNVKAENNAGLQSTVSSSNGQTVDSTVPSAISAVNDGLGTDIEYATSTMRLSGNWTASSDSQSGIAKYWYSIGTAAGGTNITGWTDNGTSTSFTQTGLSLTNGATYYVNVKAENGAGLQSSLVSSNGQMADGVAPVAISSVNDGISADIQFTTSTTQLSANWAYTNDPISGIAKYWYSIGTTPGGTSIAGWTNNNLSLSFTRTGLTLTNGTIYYVNVKAENKAGLQSTVTTSNGQKVDNTAPAAISTLNDGLGPDIEFTTSTVQLSANWTASSDSQSGIAKYWYSIGTVAGGTSITGWTDNGAALSFTRTGLTLTNGTTYYVNVKAENGAGLQSGIKSSNGIKTVTSVPSSVIVNDGTDTDIAITTSTIRISANWTASSDAQSSIAQYKYAIGKTPFGREILDWIGNGLNLTMTRNGLTLEDGTTYYVSVKAVNAAGFDSDPSCSDGQMVDSTPPSVLPSVKDGLGTDIMYTSSTIALSGNWGQAVDNESGIKRYWYAIGTTPGGTSIVTWTNNALSTSFTLTGLTLISGTRYYVSVKAENGAGLLSVAVNSDGQTADATRPSTVAYVNDGSGSDISVTTATTRLSSNWAASSDTESGISRYWYAIGTSPQGTDTLDWTDNGTATTVTRTGLSLLSEATYYITVKAENGAGIQSLSSSSNGQLVRIIDTTPPADVSLVNDGTGSDIASIVSTTTLSANWTPSHDNETGISRYWYCIGTTPGSHNILSWTDNGSATSVTRAGLSLTTDTTYYVSVEAENGVGLCSQPVSSNGQVVIVPLEAATITLSASGALKPGIVTVIVTLPASVTLLGTPVLTYTLADNSLVTILLTGSGNIWTGELCVESETPQGAAHFVFDAVDTNGNRISTILSGANFTVNTSISAAAGGSSSNRDGTRVQIPAGALGDDVNIAITVPALDSALIADANRRLSDIGLQPFTGLNLCRDFRAYTVATGAPVHTFNQAVTVTLTYPDADQNGIVDNTNVDEVSLRVFVLDDNLGRWVLVPNSSINRTSNTVSVQTSHFSVYTLIGVPGYNIIDNVACYPNPCDAKRDGYLRIAHIPLTAGNVVITIYTVAGEQVKTLRENDGIEILPGEKQGRWDGRNDGGHYVASGVYLCMIRADGGIKKIEKIAISH